MLWTVAGAAAFPPALNHKYVYLACELCNYLFCQVEKQTEELSDYAGQLWGEELGNFYTISVQVHHLIYTV